jgi:hypothetical protein
LINFLKQKYLNPIPKIKKQNMEGENFPENMDGYWGRRFFCYVMMAHAFAPTPIPHIFLPAFPHTIFASSNTKLFVCLGKSSRRDKTHITLSPLPAGASHAAADPPKPQCQPGFGFIPHRHRPHPHSSSSRSLPIQLFKHKIVCKTLAQFIQTPIYGRLFSATFLLPRPILDDDDELKTSPFTTHIYDLPLVNRPSSPSSAGHILRPPFPSISNTFHFHLSQFIRSDSFLTWGFRVKRN